MRGSIEFSTIKQAELIERSGEFYIGHEALKQRKAQALKYRRELSVADVIFLSVDKGAAQRALEARKILRQEAEAAAGPKKSTDVEMRDVEAEGLELTMTDYSYERLVELQSKLMLINGQKLAKEAKAQKQGGTSGGSQFVQKFVSMFDAVRRLANNYLRLLDEGILLFEQLDCHIFCAADEGALANQPSEKQPPVMKLKLALLPNEVVVRCAPTRSTQQQEQPDGDEGEPAGQGEHFTTHTRDSTLAGCLQTLNQFFEQRIADWHAMLSEKRLEYFELNYFTVKQIMFLCKGNYVLIIFL